MGIVVSYLPEQETGGWTDHRHQGANHGQEASYHGHGEGVAQSRDCAGVTENDKSWTPGCQTVTQQSPNRLQTIYQQSLAFLASVLRDPQLKMLVIAWHKNPGAEGQKRITTSARDQ
jgi:hypothetical protein